MVPRSMSDQPGRKPLRRRGGGSHPQHLSEAALTGRRDHDGARFAAAADPVQREATRTQRGAEGAADMQPPLAPVEARAAIETGGRTGGQLQAEASEKIHAG